jgi:hypothetical protein
MLINSVRENEDKPLLDHLLSGAAREIAGAIPPPVWGAIRDAWARARAADPPRVPTVLLLTAEPHVPWELAYVDPPLDPARPPFLSAQAAVARWISGSRGVPLPPPAAVAVRRMAVVAGDYASWTRLRPLPLAVAEASELAAAYDAEQFPATQQDIRRLLDGRDEDGGPAVAQAIHFACHGEVDRQNPHFAGIYLDDVSLLRPEMFRSAAIGREKPCLFLNACQVGNAGELLGAYAGFAGHALRAGFSGFVAPLWSVADDSARDFALEFYRGAFAHQPVSRVLHELRSRYRANGKGIPQATYLAYVFYGHPDLLLTLDQGPAG